MRLIYLPIVLATILCPQNLFSKEWEKTETGVKARIDSIDVEVSYTSGAVRVVKTPIDKPIPGQSFSVIAEPENVKIKTEQKKRTAR